MRIKPTTNTELMGKQHRIRKENSEVLRKTTPLKTICCEL